VICLALIGWVVLSPFVPIRLSSWIDVTQSRVLKLAVSPIVFAAIRRPRRTASET
jgi:hypothetical protein